jgi:hypothetical protein
MSTTPRPHGREHEHDLDERAVGALLLDTTPWLSCEECFERMDTHVESVLADSTHVDEAMAAHLRGCVACDEEAQSLLALLRQAEG